MPTGARLRLLLTKNAPRTTNPDPAREARHQRISVCVQHVRGMYLGVVRGQVVQLESKTGFGPFRYSLAVSAEAGLRGSSREDWPTDPGTYRPPMNVPVTSELLLVAAAAFLLFLTIQRTIAHHKQRPEEIAEAASLPTHQMQDAMSYGFGLTKKFDMPTAETLIRRRGEEQSRLVLQFVAAVFSIAAIIIQQRPISVSLMLKDLAISVFLAWVISSGYNRCWMIGRAPWWLAHAWLTWIEWQIGDPNNPKGYPGEDVSLVASLNPHPAFQKTLDDISAKRESTGDVVGDSALVEGRIANLAKRWRYQFHSEEWQKWYARTLSLSLPSPRVSNPS